MREELHPCQVNDAVMVPTTSNAVEQHIHIQLYAVWCAAVSSSGSLYTIHILYNF
ncbi:hypothetical protein BDR07DRAFT_1425705 [Suillus spraguei]|nr:hypothetical protein BDR07DRAFT_1425705 [Suillus spraguei]